MRLHPPNRSANRRRGARRARRRQRRCARPAGSAQDRRQRRQMALAARLSLFGDLKYPADFKHFDYVQPGCAEGRRVRARRTAPSTTSIRGRRREGLAGGGHRPRSTRR